MLTREQLEGPWAGLPVAWKEDFSFDEDAYRADVERTCKAGVPGIYTCGTTGEFYAMEFDEFKAVTIATVEECKRHNTPVMIGITSTYTLGAKRRAALAASIGADAVQCALPYWIEIDDRQIVKFFVDVSSACPELAISIYETKRAKKTLTIDQHRAIAKAIPAYRLVKSNAGTLGCTQKGCQALSEFLNVAVSERLWYDLGPSGAIGSASALVYMNPRIILKMFDLLKKQRWDELKVWCDKIDLLDREGLFPFEAKGFTDTAYDHLQGVVTGFLKMHPRSRGPYIAATDEDIDTLRRWLEKNLPEFLEL